MKYSFIILTFFLSSFALKAQDSTVSYNLKAVIVSEEDQKGIPFAQVALYKSDSIKAYKVAVTDNEGRLYISISEKGKYKLLAKSLGFDSLERTFEMNGEKINLDLGFLQMNESSQKIEEVNITAQKSLIQTEPDKMIYNTEADPDSKTNTVMEMMRKLPLVSVDGDDNIRLKGSTNFKIYMNGKPSPMLTGNAKNILKAMSASSVKKIEVITEPGAKYDAEGVGGIINIITHSKSLEGWAFSANTSASLLGRFSGGLSYSASMGKFIFSIDLGASYSLPRESESNSFRETYNSIDRRYLDAQAQRERYGLGQWGSGSFSYDIDSLNLISAKFNGWFGRQNGDSHQETRIKDINHVLTQAYNDIENMNYDYRDPEIGFDYQNTSAKDKNRIFTFSYKLNRQIDSDYQEWSIDPVLNFLSKKYKKDQIEKMSEHTFQLDYTYMLKKLKLESGLKYIMRRNRSNSDDYNFDFAKNEYPASPQKYIDFTHKQDIPAAYISVAGKKGKLSYKAGLRTEFSITTGSTAPDDSYDFNSEVVEYVPSCSFSYNVGKMNSLQLAFSKRIQRPGIWHLNPYIDDTNPKYVRSGNPNLDPEHFYSVRLSTNLFTKIGMLNLSTSYSFSNNGIGNIMRIENNDIIHSTYDNNVKKQDYNTSLSANINFSKKVSINANVSVGYNIVENKDNASQNNSGISSMSFLNIRYNIVKKLRLSAHGGIFSFPVGLQTKNGLFHFSSISLSNSFFKDKFTVSVSASSLFWKHRKYTYEMKDQDFFQKFESLSPARDFRISLSIRLGELESGVKRTRKSITNSDVKSGDGGGDSGGKSE